MCGYTAVPEDGGTCYYYFITVFCEQVAQCLLNPFGGDDDDFEINPLIEDNLQVRTSTICFRCWLFNAFLYVIFFLMANPAMSQLADWFIANRLILYLAKTSYTVLLLGGVGLGLLYDFRCAEIKFQVLFTAGCLSELQLV